jgi:hypothetical protein
MNISDYKLIKTKSLLPSFYICKDCNYIGEVGSGKVKIWGRYESKTNYCGI